VSFFQDAFARIAAVPGVVHVAGSWCTPLTVCIGTSFWPVDRPRPADGQLSSAQIRPITTGFFDTLGIPRFAGRDFADSDASDSLPVAIVSDAVAREQFPDGNPLGRRLRINVTHTNGNSDVEWTIVGVVGNIKSSLEGPVRQTIYVPTTQISTVGMRVFVRTRQDPMLLAPTMESIIHAREPEAPVEARALDDIVRGSMARPRAISVLVGVFALVALTLAAVGVYGVMAYLVRERTQEIGVRMALGANAASMFRLFLGQALRLVTVGVVVGLIAAGAVTRLLEQLLFGVEPLDPWTFVGTAVVLIVVATIASFVPARRAMRMAPVDALRAV
jgi:putative ABC transport system permease protein